MWYVVKALSNVACIHRYTTNVLVMQYKSILCIIGTWWNDTIDTIRLRVLYWSACLICDDAILHHPTYHIPYVTYLHICPSVYHSPFQPTYDSWQLQHILGYPLLDLDADNHEQTSVINQFGMNMSNNLLAVIPDSRSAVFFDSCLHHGYYRMFHVVTDSTLMTANEAFFIWYREMVIGHGGEGIAHTKPKIYSQIESYPCESCCPKGQVGQRK